MKNAKFILIFTLLISFLSCNNEKIAELNNRISELEKQNFKLTDSIKKLKYQELFTLSLIGIPYKSTFRVGEKSRIKFFFNHHKKIMPYNVYTTTNEGKLDKLIFKNLTGNEFEYRFVPSKIGGEQIKLVAVFKIGNDDKEEIHVPTNLFVKIKE